MYICVINTNIVFGVIAFRQMCVYYVYMKMVCVIKHIEAHLVSAYFSLLLLFCVFFGQIHTTCFAYLCRHLTVIKTKQTPKLHLLHTSVDIKNSPFDEEWNSTTTVNWALKCRACKCWLQIVMIKHKCGPKLRISLCTTGTSSFYFFLRRDLM